MAGLFSKRVDRFAMRLLSRPWTEQDTALLKKLHASGASALRASIALKRNKLQLMARARQLGIPFMSLRERRKRQTERERTELAGLPKRS
jgi:hypothetical protein